VPLASAVSMLSLLNILYTAYLVGRGRVSRTYAGSAITGSCSLLLLSWVFSFSALNGVIYSSSLSPLAWAAFYSAGYPLKSVIENTVAQTTPAVITGCNVDIILSEGAVILSVATSLSFITSLILCCIRCGIR
jgi:hypothetical protein